MANAAKNLVPVTLELGGKSPAIVADDYDLAKAMQRILGGKAYNSGQTCVAPDYLYVPEHRLK
ncbi:aldehyde dehydrogenase family protein [Photobacterium leiognathi]|uniref:aldehyde dehydrogenase family protein n=1 Tax=Photobacterium leiognathi TaxID=553611 RepID=UPI0027367BE2|nr:aldehyde dehydrogenase family protein [Photobacterium leiognathi]